jgi:hypothetical protein
MRTRVARSNDSTSKATSTGPSLLRRARSATSRGRARGEMSPKAPPAAHDIGAISILGPKAAPRSMIDVPSIDAEKEVIDLPPGGGGGTVTPPAAADACAQPRSMHKRTSGALLNGLTMDSYYPDLTGGGYWDHAGTAGVFDVVMPGVGRTAGASVQLYGVIPGPCLPSQYRLEQTAKKTRYRIDGAVQPEEGKTVDDIAASRRDASRAPFRQDFLGGGAAPRGYIISMADPPSTPYRGSSNIELDRDFVTSLAGPGGRKSVSWSTSTRISRGRVTHNTVS